MESFKDYVEPVAKMALDVKEKLESYEYPPSIVDAYKRGASSLGAEDISPVYVGAGFVAATGVLLLACRSCKAAPQVKVRGSKKSKAKAKPTANGSVHQSGGNGKGGETSARGAAVNGGSGARDLSIDQSKPPVGGAKAATGKPAKKGQAKAPQPQGKVKGKGKPAPEAPPVITEEPEPATKKVSKKAARKAKAAAAIAAAAAPAAASKKTPKGSVAANGSGSSGAGSRQAQHNGGGGAGESDPWGAQHVGGEWQTGPIAAQEGEWETVSHKKSKPRKEKAAMDDTNTIPGGLSV